MGFALKKPKDVPGKSWPAVSSQLPTILLQQSSFETDCHWFVRRVWRRFGKLREHFSSYSGVSHEGFLLIHHPFSSRNMSREQQLQIPFIRNIANSPLAYSLAMTQALYLASLL
jgi:hypothetical protein